MIYTLRKTKGFTIVETLLAISIIITIVMGTTKAVQRGLSLYIFSKDQIIGFYLAQEGFEQIRNMRDTNKLNDRNWLFGIAYDSTDPCYFGKACTVSPVEASFATACSAPGACPLLRQSATTGFYGYDISWTPTLFTRQITLTSVATDEVAVTVTVTWSKGGSTRQFSARENLFNWQ